jgi:hypothetical protein
MMGETALSYTFDVHKSVHCGIITKATNKMQLYRSIYYSQSALHVLGDVFTHYQEHLHSVLLLSTFVTNSKRLCKRQCNTLQTWLKNQYHALSLSEITHRSLWGAIKCFCGNVQIFFFLFVRGGRQRKGDCIYNVYTDVVNTVVLLMMGENIARNM